MTNAAALRKVIRWIFRALLLGLLLSFPYLPFVPFSFLGNVNLAAHYALVAISIVVLTGWVGQISLGHAGFVGVGAYITGMAAGAFNITFPVSMLWGAAAGTIIAMIFGVVALRVRGLYLAVATLIFSWMAEAFLFRQKWFTKYSTIDLQPIGQKDTLPYFDWSSREVLYYAAWATVLLAIFLMANLRESKNGRAFFAVRGSEVAAASLGINIMRSKLVAFAISGFLAGAAGGLMMVMDGTVSPDAFKVDQSLLLLSIAVVGGLSSLGGAVAAGLLFAFLNQAFYEVEALGGYLEVVSAVLLAGTLLLYRGGLAAIPASIRPVLQWIHKLLAPIFKLIDVLLESSGKAIAPLLGSFAKPTRRKRNVVPGVVRRPRESSGLIRKGISQLTRGRVKLGPKAVVREVPLDLFNLAGDDEMSREVNGTASDSGPQEPPEVEAPTTWRTFAAAGHSIPRPNREEARPVIETEGITVRFGGLTACSDVSLKVCEGEIVGLIGPNGAGKTTFFNAVAGLNQPSSGRVMIYGQDVTDLAVHERAESGVARTFQAIQLFGQLSVFENLLVATHQHNETGLMGNLFVTRSALSAEIEARRQVKRVVELFELESVADRPAKDLPFGVLRMVEVARALVTRSRIIMLDEPASGLDNNETDRLTEILRFVRSLGVTLLLIEHDVRMVTSVSDYMYVLDGGKLLAEGTPEQIQRDELVVAAYLGQAAEKETAAV